MHHQGTILVVDDTPANLKLLVDLLTAEGYEVLPADSGELAFAAIAAHPPELILLDIRMPGMDGFEVYRRLQAQTANQQVPVIFISALSESAERAEGLTLGAVDFITKPIQPDELLARVQTQLELRRLRVRSDQQAADLQRANAQLQAELAAVQAERIRLTALIGSIADEVWFADTQGRFTLANRSALQEFRLAPDEPIEVAKLTRSLEVLRADGSPRPVEEAPPLRALAGEVGVTARNGT